MKTLTIKLTDTMDTALGAVARRRRISKSALVRRALEKAVNGRTPSRRGTVADVVGDLLGSVEGPGDLSCNKAYLDDLGRS